MLDEPNRQKTIDAAARPITNFVMSRYIGSRLLPNSPSFPPGSKVKDVPSVRRNTTSHNIANSPTAVTIPGSPANDML
jgi:hypothetical protein